ncbi:MAG TPA: hypothetical protein DHK64_11615, partial [Rhodobiaceae bacterium]|nr:hypothetical protein [Rhodobiaceae bacterium]
PLVLCLEAVTFTDAPQAGDIILLRRTKNCAALPPIFVKMKSRNTEVASCAMAETIRRQFPGGQCKGQSDGYIQQGDASNHFLLHTSSLTYAVFCLSFYPRVMVSTYLLL